MTTSEPRNSELVYFDFPTTGSLPELLGLTPPPFGEPKDPFRQLNYVYSHVKELGCKTILLEKHYIDRHYIEDHSLFYSRNYRSLPNFCQRLHFFNVDQDQVRKKFDEILNEGKLNGRSAYKRAGALFSEESYLGFCVIKPLVGSPVGRTVLRTYGEQADGTNRRIFASTRRYKAHMAGSELKIQGLAFQQQDVGVSACATTALWSSLQQARQFEKIRPATPAQITMLASQYALPFGRALPSEGLSVGQMSQAIQALGASPNMFRVLKKYDDARSYLHSATLSGFAPVLVLQLAGNADVNHAVTVTGVKVDSSYDPNLSPTPLVDRSGELKAVYIHDDRVGLYIRADIKPSNKSLHFDVDYKGLYDAEEWLLTHILIPLHPKIRISFTGLRRLATKVVIECAKEIKGLISPSSRADFPKIVYDTRIQRSTEYIEELVYDQNSLSISKLSEVFSNILFSRYVGVIRISSEPFGAFDLLIDTTSTMRNINYLGVISRGEAKTLGSHFANWLSSQCNCKAVIQLP